MLAEQSVYLEEDLPINANSSSFIVLSLVDIYRASVELWRGLLVIDQAYGAAG